MSLASVVLEIVGEMEETGKEYLDHASGGLFYDFARQLRRAAQSAEGATPTVIQGGGDVIVSQEEILKAFGCRPTGPADAEKRRHDAAASREESKADMMLELVGPGESTCPSFHMVPGSMPTGAKTAVGKCVYVLKEDRKLHYSEEDTLKAFPR